MGSGHQRAIAYQNSIAAQTQAGRAEEQRQYNERSLGEMESLVGTDEQVAGLGADGKLQAYTGRYVFDQATFDQLKGSSKYTARNAGLQDSITGGISSANALMEQAEQAARGGNFEEAERLRTQAEGSLGGGVGAMWGKSTARLTRDPAAEARAKVSNPMAQAVGSMVRDARAFQDWDSSRSRDFRERMAEPAERGIAAQAEASQRTARDFGLQRGAGRNALAAGALNAETMRKAGMDRAQVQAQVGQFFEQYRRGFAQDAIGFAQAWMQGQSGVREQFQGAMDNLKGMGAELFTKTAEMAQQFSAQASAESEAKRQRHSEALGSAVGAIGTIGGAIVGGVFGGPAGAMMGAKIGSMAGGAAGGK